MHIFNTNEFVDIVVLRHQFQETEVKADQLKFEVSDGVVQDTRIKRNSVGFSIVGLGVFKILFLLIDRLFLFHLSARIVKK